MTRTAAQEADAIAESVLTPEAAEKINQAADMIRAGLNPVLVLRLLYGLAYMDGMLSFANIGMTKQ